MRFKTSAVRTSLLFVLLPAILFAQEVAPVKPKTVAERLGYPANSRLLVLHADDLGMTHSMNKAGIEALNNKWITSASILVPCPWFPEFAAAARQHPEWDIGIHLALTSEWDPERWRPLSVPSTGSSLTDKDGYFPHTGDEVYKQAIVSDIDRELRAQIDTALAAKIQLTHLDAHMFVAGRAAPDDYAKIGREYHLPVLSDHDSLQIKTDPSFVLIDKIVGLQATVPDGQWLNAYENILRPLPPGSYLLLLHLAYDDDEMSAATAGHTDWGAHWRQNDFNLVKDPAFQKFLRDQHFILVSWRDLAKALPPDYNQPAPK
jgi:chitin disaccharide deacetylase